MILVNFKVYKETFGIGAERLAEVCKKVMDDSGVKIIPVVAAFDVIRVKKIIGDSDVFIQSIDNTDEGAMTGSISAQQAISAGANGTLLNHSEKRMEPGKIKSLLAKLPDGFTSVVCIQTVGQAEGWAKNMKADYIAYEPAYLIGNREKSVSSEEPEKIKEMVAIFAGKPVLVGAGIHQVDDIKSALALGARGVLLASDVVKSNDPETDLAELARGFSI